MRGSGVTEGVIPVEEERGGEEKMEVTGILLQMVEKTMYDVLDASRVKGEDSGHSICVEGGGVR